MPIPETIYEASGVFVTEEERQRVVNAREFSGLWTCEGAALGSPQAEVNLLALKYKVPSDWGFNPRDGQFYKPRKETPPMA